jgi:hypothetical protein
VDNKKKYHRSHDDESTSNKLVGAIDHDGHGRCRWTIKKSITVPATMSQLQTGWLVPSTTMSMDDVAGQLKKVSRDDKSIWNGLVDAISHDGHGQCP